MSVEFKLMAYKSAYIVIEDYNANSYMIGTRNGADLTGGTIVTGSAKGDLNGYTATFTGEERTPANWMTGAVEGNPFADAAMLVTVVEGT